jgi:hypothetical protein
MSVDITSELWNEIKRYINTVDRPEAAETLVSVLIDNNVDADEIRQSFKGDADVKRALVEYLKDESEHTDEDEEYEDEEFDEDEDY